MGKRHFIDIVTDAGGAFTGYGPKTSGKIESVHYIKDAGANPLAATADIVVTVESTTEAVITMTDINATTHFRPRVPTVSPANAAQLYASGGTAVNGHIDIGSDRIKIVVAQGGATKIGRVVIIMA